jgi:hypothetical protein
MTDALLRSVPRLVAALLALGFAGPPALSEDRIHDTLYPALAADVKAGKPITIATYIGLWYTYNDDPERNLYWGALYGHKTMFEVAAGRYRNGRIQAHLPQDYTFVAWRRLRLVEADRDPRRIAVYEMRVAPNAEWRALGIEAPFVVRQVFVVYSDMERAVRDLASAAKRDEGVRIRLDDGGEIDVGRDARILGYSGHNVYYGEACGIDDLETLEATTSRTKGLFFFGCQSYQCAPEKFLGENRIGMLFTSSNMAPEGYLSLGLADAIAQGWSGERLRGHLDRIYRRWQERGNGTRPGALFLDESSPRIRARLD